MQSGRIEHLAGSLCTGYPRRNLTHFRERRFYLVLRIEAEQKRRNHKQQNPKSHYFYPTIDCSNWQSPDRSEYEGNPRTAILKSSQVRPASLPLLHRFAPKLFVFSIPSPALSHRSRGTRSHAHGPLPAFLPVRSEWWFAAAILFLAGCPSISEPQATRQPKDSTVSETVDTDPNDTKKLEARINAVLKSNLENRRLSTDVQAAWQVLHGVLAYGRDFKIKNGSDDVIAVDHILRGGAVTGFELRSGDRFETDIASDDPTLTRGIRAELDPGSKRGQGHRDQWLAYLNSCDLPIDQVIQTIDGPRRLDLWLRQMEWDVPLNFEREYSWTLMSIIPYRETTHRWIARDGNTYSIESLLRSELDQLSPSSACGGSHRLTAVATALRKRNAEGGAITGVWSDAQSMLEIAMETAFDFQNADATFSSNYFERAGWSLDLATAIGTTGHTLEFIAVAAPNLFVTEPRVQRAANKLCEMLELTAELDLECGALYHALSGLQIYRQRLLAITASS